MFCTEQQWKHCQVEKRGHEGCFFNDDKNKEEMKENEEIREGRKS